MPPSRRKQSTAFDARVYEEKQLKWKLYEQDKQPPISDEDLKAAKEAFFMHDLDNSGAIEANELKLMLKQMGQNPTDDEVRKIISEADAKCASGNGDGRIQMREWIMWFARLRQKKRAVQDEDVIDAYHALGNATDALRGPEHAGLA